MLMSLTAQVEAEDDDLVSSNDGEVREAQTIFFRSFIKIFKIVRSSDHHLLFKKEVYFQVGNFSGAYF